MATPLCAEKPDDQLMLGDSPDTNRSIQQVETLVPRTAGGFHNSVLSISLSPLFIAQFLTARQNIMERISAMLREIIHLITDFTF